MFFLIPVFICGETLLTNSSLACENTLKGFLHLYSQGLQGENHPLP